MGPRPVIAHVADDGRTHDLYDHLKSTAEEAAGAARSFSSEDWAKLAGFWHDLGKFAKAFQDYIYSSSGLDAHLEGVPGRVDHSTAGALLARQQFKEAGLPLCFVIAGHHAGLADKTDLFNERLPNKAPLLQPALDGGGNALANQSTPTPPAFLRGVAGGDKQQLLRSYEFWVRMLYSALVDADFLDTEAFHEQGKSLGKPRLRAPGESLKQLNERFDTYMADKQAKATAPGTEKSQVNAARDRVLQACRQQGLKAQGVFSLTAPTGIGKTLAAMAFGLEHAATHGLRRVIAVIPYTSIIEQNARQYREVFGAKNVVEHHASLDPVKETTQNRLACENWDAPVIVTTSVQFLESLLANRSSRCRKLHNIARSVVVFDEVQTLPIGQLAPVLDVLKELVRNYSVSLVLSTATQPALGYRSSGLSSHFPGFERITEIVPDLSRTFESLRRVEIRWPESLDEPVTWEQLAERIKAELRVLAIVHKRDDARTLTRLLPDDTLHLSALMCAAHRSRVLARVKRLLKWTAKPVRVVSTQLVEAGVDLDFPVVYRALGGLDAIAQAAGRCNREGKLPGKGQVRVFVAPTRQPSGTPVRAAEVTRMMLAANPTLDPLKPDGFEEYFRRLYYVHNLDGQGIQREREAWNFKTVAETFSLIEDDGSEPIVVPYGAAAKRLEELRRANPAQFRYRLRAIQPFVVAVYPQQRKALEDAGALEFIADTVLALRETHSHLYDERFGLVLEGPFAMKPASQVV